MASPETLNSGHVEAIWIRAESNGTPESLERATLEAGRGIAGDRYWNGIRASRASRAVP